MGEIKTTLPLPTSMEKLSSMKLVPGAKKGWRWLCQSILKRQQASAQLYTLSASLFPLILRLPPRGRMTPFSDSRTVRLKSQRVCRKCRSALCVHFPASDSHTVKKQPTFPSEKHTSHPHPCPIPAGSSCMPWSPSSAALPASQLLPRVKLSLFQPLPTLVSPC